MLWKPNRISFGRIRRYSRRGIAPSAIHAKPIAHGLQRCSFAVSKSIAITFIVPPEAIVDTTAQGSLPPSQHSSAADKSQPFVLRKNGYAEFLSVAQLRAGSSPSYEEIRP